MLSVVMLNVVAPVFVHGKPFKPSLMFESKARSIPKSERCFPRAGNKHSSLLQAFVNYDRKKY
jgi:hypothetical protein